MNSIAAPRKEFTIRGLIIGIVITLVFTAANVYFGLKAGLTFSTSIPAAVISMAILKAVRDATIQENNIVQTVASAAGTLSSIIFVLPGLIMVGWWTGFPFWMSFVICVTGGILGVMYTIPLRRALVTDSDLPYPEGVACAEVLKVGAAGNEKLAGITTQDQRHAAGAAAAQASGAGLRAVVAGAIVSAIFYIIVQTKLFASDVAQYFRIGDKGSASGYDFSLSFVLFGVGHLVGLWVGVAMWCRRVDRLGLGGAVFHRAASDGRRGCGCGARRMEPLRALRRRRHHRRGGDLDTLAKLVKPVIWRARRRDCRAASARKAGTCAIPCRAPSMTCPSAWSVWSRCSA